jgi:hypothetical protein
MTRILVIALVVVAVLTGVIYWLSSDGPVGRNAPDTPPEPGESRSGTHAEAPPKSPAKKTAGASVSGDVIAETGEPGRDAAIRLVALNAEMWPRPGEPVMTVTADARGRFAVEEVPAGLYRVEARSGKACGYVPLLRVRKDAATRVLVRLASLVSIRGFVLSEDGTPIAGATVSADLGGVNRAIVVATGAQSRRLFEPLAVTTDVHGAFALGDLPRGQYEIEVEAPGHRSSRIPSVNAPVDDIEIRLFGTFELDGTVRWAGRSKIDTIRISCGGREIVLRDQISPASFTFDDLTRGRYVVRAVADGYAPMEQEISIETGRRAGPIEFRLEPGAMIGGWVKSRKGMISGYDLVFFRVRRVRYSQDREYELEETVSVPVSSGTYRATLTPGEWVARLRSPNGIVHRSSEKVRNEIFEVERKRGWQHFRFDLLGVVRGRVRYEDGWAAGGVTVRCYRNSTTTKRDGTFELMKLDLEREIEVEATDRLSTVSKVVKLNRNRPGREITLTLPRRGTEVARGQVISEENEPVGGATVLFEDGFAITDPDGRFERRDVRPGRNSLRFFAPGYSMGMSKPFVVSGGKAVEPKRLILPWHPSRVTGRVFDLQGDPIVGASVRIRFPDLGQEFETVTDPKGRFLQEGPGAIEEKAVIEVRARGYRDGRRSIRVQPDVEETEFRLAPERVSK